MNGVQRNLLQRCLQVVHLSHSNFIGVGCRQKNLSLKYPAFFPMHRMENDENLLVDAASQIQHNLQQKRESFFEMNARKQIQQICVLMEVAFSSVCIKKKKKRDFLRLEFFLKCICLLNLSMINLPPKNTLVKSFDVLRSSVYLCKDIFHARTALINIMVCCRP